MMYPQLSFRSKNVLLTSNSLLRDEPKKLHDPWAAASRLNDAHTEGNLADATEKLQSPVPAISGDRSTAPPELLVERL